jgi:hypothetical protein
MDEARALQLIDEIDESLNELLEKHFFNPEIFIILDDVDADRREIDAARSKLSEAVWVRLHSIASSVYSGTMRRGDVSSFYDVVSRLGMHHTKVMIILLGFHQLANRDREVEVIFARSFATSVMASILAFQMGFRESSAQRAELGGLFLEIGRQMIVLYKNTINPDSPEIDDAFIETYHPSLAIKIINRFSLPDFLETIVQDQTVILEENAVSLPGVVYLAWDMVRASFQKYGNRLVIRCQEPKPGTDVSRNLEAIIRNKFRAASLDNHLILQRVPRLHTI